ncbi:MAG TPA: type II toxin-antitoxin system VapC family toxin [Vicinamibacterales bacterium]|nr:type II toxin-antitoxin system VapC family toxin [Vicinamibacterales bacterium]
MSVFVVDASLVIKWFVPEVDSEAARRWLDAPHDYVAPDLLFPETGNTVWKKVRRGEVSPDNGQQLVTDLSVIAVEAVSMRGLLPDAHALALETGITVYDATYLALAVRLETQVITGDDRFARRLADYPLLAPHVRSLEDFAE